MLTAIGRMRQGELELYLAALPTRLPPAAKRRAIQGGGDLVLGGGLQVTFRSVLFFVAALALAMAGRRSLRRVAGGLGRALSL